MASKVPVREEQPTSFIKALTGCLKKGPLLSTCKVSTSAFLMFYLVYAICDSCSIMLLNLV